MVGNSAPIRQVFEQIRLVASSRSTVQIFGESSTGKERVTRALHQLSPRKEGDEGIRATMLEPGRTFQIAIAGEELSVEFTPRLLPRDQPAFIHQPQTALPQPNQPLVAVRPERHGHRAWRPGSLRGLYAEAKLQGTEKELLAVFEGKYPEAKPRRKTARPKEQLPVGEHTARVFSEPETPGKGTVQGTLF